MAHKRTGDNIDFYDSRPLKKFCTAELELELESQNEDEKCPGDICNYEDEYDEDELEFGTGDVEYYSNPNCPSGIWDCDICNDEHVYDEVKPNHCNYEHFNCNEHRNYQSNIEIIKLLLDRNLK